MENVNQKQLFVASCLALVVTAMTFAIRAKIEGVFSTDYGLTKEQIGYAFGPAFWGFAIAMFLGGFIIDIVKTKNILRMAFGLHLVGIILLLFAKDMISLYCQCIHRFGKSEAWRQHVILWYLPCFRKRRPRC